MAPKSRPGKVSRSSWLKKKRVQKMVVRKITTSSIFNQKTSKKNPLRAKKLKERKGSVESCIKRKLGFDTKLVNFLRNWVETISKIMANGSRQLNYYIIYSIAGRDLEALHFEDQTWWQHRFREFSNIPPDGSFDAYKPLEYAVKQYTTNFLVSTVHNYQGRQLRYLRAVLEKMKEDITPSFVQCQINGWTWHSEQEEASEDVKKLIKEEQNRLGRVGDEVIDDTYLQNHLHIIMKYYYHILGYFEQHNSCPENEKKRLKLFTLAPVCAVKGHFITIDLQTLWKIARIMEWITGDEADFRHNESAVGRCWQPFNIPRAGGGRVFSNLIQTDGVSIVYHFLRKKKGEEEGEQPQEEEQHPIEPKKKKKKEEKKPIQYTPGQRIIAIDPGMVNRVYAVECNPDGSPLRTYCLTKGQYRTDSGIVREQKRQQNRASSFWKRIQQQHPGLDSLGSIKTASLEMFKDYWDKYRKVQDALWGEFIKPKYANSRFRIYRLKNRTIDRFFQTMRGPKDSAPPVVGYGAANFWHNGKYSLSHPTTTLARYCSHHFQTVMIDEYNTTKCCAYCGNQLHAIAVETRNEDGKKVKKPIRGLRWCCSPNCRDIRNRDLNAALNIYTCTVCQLSHQMRPKELTPNNSGRNPVSGPLEYLVWYGHKGSSCSMESQEMEVDTISTIQE